MVSYKAIFLAFAITSTVSSMALVPDSDLEIRGDCDYNGGNDYNGNNGKGVGAKCSRDGDCTGGANCCSGKCKLGSCRDADDGCDASNDCYGQCGNNAKAVCCKKKRANGAILGYCGCSGKC